VLVTSRGTRRPSPELKSNSARTVFRKKRSFARAANECVFASGLPKTRKRKSCVAFRRKSRTAAL